MSVLHFRHVDSRSGFHFARFVHLPTRWILKGNIVRDEMDESIRRVLVRCRLHISSDYSVYIHPCDGVSPSLLYYHDQAQDTGTSRWTVREHTATEEQTKQKRPSHVYCHRISVCVSTNSLIIGYPTLARPRSMQLSCGFGLYYDVMDYMAVGYCAINPIICFVFSSNYRQGPKRLMNSVRPSYRRKVQKSAGNWIHQKRVIMEHSQMKTIL